MTALRHSRTVANGWYVGRIAELTPPEKQALLAALPALRRLSKVVGRRHPKVFPGPAAANAVSAL